MRKTILSLALAVAMMAALTACSGGGDPVGTYEATKMGDSSGEYSIDDAEQNGFFEISNALEIKSDGNATLTFTRTISPEAEKQMSAQDLATAKRIYSLGTESGSGTWEMKGNEITIFFPGTPWTGTVDDDTITFNYDGGSYPVFEKIK